MQTCQHKQNTCTSIIEIFVLSNTYITRGQPQCEGENPQNQKEKRTQSVFVGTKVLTSSQKCKKCEV